MNSDSPRPGISRRTLLVGGGAGVGLVVAWALWPREYRPNLRAGPGETPFNAFLRIGADGRVIVAVPQAEMGQGVYTSLPQIIADELGAEWQTVAVEPSPISPLYANNLLAEEIAGDALPGAFQGIGRWAAREYATRSALMLTGGSSSVRSFEPRLREAGAAARVLLCMAAAERWGVEWETLDTRGGFVVDGNRRLAFGPLAEAAAGFDPPATLPMRGGVEGRLAGQPLPRIDLPAKVDGSAQFAADIRLPDMVYASVRAGPVGGGRMVGVNRDAADAVPGVMAIFEHPHWAGAVATNWWAANRAVEAMKPAFIVDGALVGNEGIEDALATALDEGAGRRLYARGDVGAAFAEGNLFRARYFAGVSPSAAMEPLTATARLTGDRLEVWAATQAPALARTAAARAAGLPEGQVMLYQTLAGGGYGRRIETEAIAQAVHMTIQVKRPVQLTWSRIEETVQDGFRPPAHAEMIAKLEEGGRISAWHARIAAPDALGQVIARLGAEPPGAPRANGAAVSGALPPYAIPSVAVDHMPAETGLRLGIARAGAHGCTAFFTESFVDELARQADVEPLSFRMQMLGDNPRLARVLSTAAAIGGWDGGARGSMLGLAAHSAFGSHIALLVEIVVEGTEIRVVRATAAVDCGSVVNPEIVRQLIEGGIVHGIAAATGDPIAIDEGRVQALGFGDLGLPTLAASPEINVEIVPSDEPPGGVTELGVPPTAPAIANALFAATGQRLRALPLVIGGR